MSALRKMFPGPIGERSAYRFVPIADVTTPRSGTFDHYANHYWAVADGCILLFRGHSPQCNSDQRVVERIKPAWAEVQYYPMVFLPHECEP